MRPGSERGFRACRKTRWKYVPMSSPGESFMKWKSLIDTPLARNRQRQGADFDRQPMIAGFDRCLETRLVAPSCLRPRSRRNT